MCKVLIHRVIEAKPVKRGKGDDGRPWELHIFDCEVSVDGSGLKAVRTVKTFAPELAGQLGAGKTFEAIKEGSAPPFKFMLANPRRTAGRGEAKNNRQVAFEAANTLVSAGLRAGKYESPDEAATATLGFATMYLGFLEGGSK